MSKRIVVSVISDLTSDQRVHKVCTFLHQKGFHVILIGRKTKNSLPLQKRDYTTERIFCSFNNGVLLYAEFMVKLFFRLFKKTDLFLSNDLDTLLPNFLHAKIRSKKLIYDSHEYFTGVPELSDTPYKKKTWQLLEAFLLPKTDAAYTVNKSIAELFKHQYNVHMKVVRNLPYLSNKSSVIPNIQFPGDKFIILLQGAGINTGRGGEELVQSMALLPPDFILYLIGSGTSWISLKKMVADLNLTNKVCFIEKVPFEQLSYYTRQASLGVSLDKPSSVNYELSLPNKIFDYIHAGIPVLASSIKEVRYVIEHYQVGIIVDEVTPQAIAKCILYIYQNKSLYDSWKANTAKAASELCWEHEERILQSIFSQYH